MVSSSASSRAGSATVSGTPSPAGSGGSVVYHLSTRSSERRPVRASDSSSDLLGRPLSLSLRCQAHRIPAATCKSFSAPCSTNCTHSISNRTVSRSSGSVLTAAWITSYRKSASSLPSGTRLVSLSPSTSTSVAASRTFRYAAVKPFCLLKAGSTVLLPCACGVSPCASELRRHPRSVAPSFAYRYQCTTAPLRGYPGTRSAASAQFLYLTAGKSERAALVNKNAQAALGRPARLLQSSFGDELDLVLVVNVEHDGGQQHQSLDDLLPIDADAHDGHAVVHHAHDERTHHRTEHFAHTTRG